MSTPNSTTEHHEIPSLGSYFMELKSRIIKHKCEPDKPYDIRVLLVDDNANSMLVETAMLEEMNHCKVTPAVDGADAIYKYLHDDFDIILMDIRMPDMNGYETATSIREIESWNSDHPHMPIVAITAKAMDGERSKCLSSGMDDYICKPIRQAAMAKMLHSWTNN